MKFSSNRKKLFKPTALRKAKFVYICGLSECDRINSLTTEKQTTKVSSANFQKNVKSKLYHIENSKTRGQTV